MGLILDTSELIYAERNNVSLTKLLTSYAPEEQFGMSVLTLAEFQHGLRHAATHGQRDRRHSLLGSAMQMLKVLPITAEVALLTGDLDAELQLRGERIAIQDLLIAATAIAHGMELSTRNQRHFQRVPGLTVISPDLPQPELKP